MRLSNCCRVGLAADTLRHLAAQSLVGKRRDEIVKWREGDLTIALPDEREIFGMSIAVADEDVENRPSQHLIDSDGGVRKLLGGKLDARRERWAAFRVQSNAG